MAPLSIDELVARARTWVERSTQGCRPEIAAAIMAWECLAHFLDRQWVIENILTATRRNTFFGPHANESWDVTRHRVMAIELGEMFFNMQYVDGFDHRVRTFRNETLESVVGELAGAAWYVRAGMRISFRDTPDLLIRSSCDYLFHSEVKTKLHGVVLSSDTILKSLRKARSQLPPNEPGVVTLKIPDAWAADESINSVMNESMRRCFRNSNRIGAVLLHWMEVNHNLLPLRAYIWRYRLELNHRSPHSIEIGNTLRALDSIYCRPHWISFMPLAAQHFADLQSINAPCESPDVKSFYIPVRALLGED